MTESIFNSIAGVGAFLANLFTIIPALLKNDAKKVFRLLLLSLGITITMMVVSTLLFLKMHDHELERHFVKLFATRNESGLWLVVSLSWPIFYLFIKDGTYSSNRKLQNFRIRVLDIATFILVALFHVVYYVPSLNNILDIPVHRADERIYLCKLDGEREEQKYPDKSTEASFSIPKGYTFEIKKELNQIRELGYDNPYLLKNQSEIVLKKGQYVLVEDEYYKISEGHSFIDINKGETKEYLPRSTTFKVVAQNNRGYSIRVNTNSGFIKSGIAILFSTFLTAAILFNFLLIVNNCTGITLMKNKIRGCISKLVNACIALLCDFSILILLIITICLIIQNLCSPTSYFITTMLIFIWLLFLRIRVRIEKSNSNVE